MSYIHTEKKKKKENSVLYNFGSEISFYKVVDTTSNCVNDNNVDIPLLISHCGVLLKGYFVDVNIFMNSLWRLKNHAFILLSKNLPFPLCFFCS